MRDVGAGIRIIMKWIKLYKLWSVGLFSMVRRWGH